MLMKTLRLVNYGGIYNGMQLNDICIDFTKCKSSSHIILVVGSNGSGKSTIVKAMKPLPDSNDCFIANENAMKFIEYIDEQYNVIYSIKYIHEVKNGSRCTAKGYIYKTMPDGSVIDLNPGGNITSCKEIVFDEFQLDPNYISLMQLSSTERGLADLRPAERKKFVNSILNSTEIYNNYYKTLSKKSAMHKELVTSMKNKIDSIGNPGYLEARYRELESTIQSQEAIMDKNKEIVTISRQKLEELKEDENENENLLEIKNKNSELANILSQKLQKINNTKSDIIKDRIGWNNLEILDAYQCVVDEAIECTMDESKELSQKIDKLKNENIQILKDREVDAAELESKQNKLSSLTYGHSYNEYMNLAENYQKEIDSIKRSFPYIDCENITTKEYMKLCDTLRRLIDLTKDRVITTIYYGIEDIPNLQTELNNLNIQIVTLQKSISDYELIYSKYDTMVDMLGKNEKPEDCVSSTCPYLIGYYKAQSIIDGLNKQYGSQNDIYKLIQEYKEELEKKQNLVETSSNVLNDLMLLKEVKLNLDSVFYIIEKLVQEEFGGAKDAISFIYNLTNNGYSVNKKLNEMYSLLSIGLDKIDSLDNYKYYTKMLEEVNAKLNGMKTNQDFIDSLTNDIAKLNTTLEVSYQKSIENNSKIKQYSEEIQIHLNELETLKYLQKNINNCIDIRNSYLSVQKIITDKEEIIEEMSKYSASYNTAMNNIQSIAQTLEACKKEKEEISYNLRMCSQYVAELQQYTANYQKIETIKYYTSPSTGIQLMFVNMYMNNILNNANRLLTGLFGGQFSLMPFIISSTEFRIPVAVDCGLNHEDITTMSSAQISLISMIISVALLNQTSTKLNIIIGDEIDAPFDTVNRIQFFDILKKLMTLVNSNQCVLISHNSEIEESDCDVIFLKNENGAQTSGNVIWSYYQ